MTSDRRLVAVWLALVAATLLAWLVGEDHLLGDTARASAAAALAIGFLKARWVGRAFMELDRAPAWLRRLFDGWIGVVGTTLVVLLLAL